MFCDLHTHSTFSDGTFSPTEIVLKAKEIGLDAVALCDHNTVAGLDEFVSAGKRYGITTVAGIEFSTEFFFFLLFFVCLCFFIGFLFWCVDY